jgi:hypothetical protein
MKKFLRTIFAVLLCGFLPAVSSGDLITIGLTGNVSQIDDQYNFFGGQIQIDDTVTGTYTYDTSVLDSEPCDPSRGRYWHYSPPCGVSVSINGFNFRTDPNNVRFLFGIVNNGSGGEDIYWFHSYSNSPLPNGTLVDSIGWQIEDYSGTALSSDALPITAPDLTNWTRNYGLDIHGDGRVWPYYIAVEVTSAVLIPEPATLLLLAFGVTLFKRR